MTDSQESGPDPDAWILDCYCGEPTASLVDADKVEHSDGLQDVVNKEPAWSASTIQAEIHEILLEVSEELDGDVTQVADRIEHKVEEVFQDR